MEPLWSPAVAFAGLLVFAAGFSWLLRVVRAPGLGWLALAGAAALAASVLTGVAPLLAAAYLGDHGGLAEAQYVLLNGMRQAAHWLYSLFAGAWAGLLVGVVLVSPLRAPAAQ